MAALLGEREIADAASCASEALARSLTRDFSISSERDAGEFLLDQTCAYENTGNPLHLEAARCCVEKVLELQNPGTGGLDLPTAPEACDCPDKKFHLGGNPDSAGVLLRGLIRYYGMTKAVPVRTAIIHLADWIMAEGYDPNTQMLYHVTACPKYNCRGTVRPGNVLDGILAVGKMTGDPKYAAFAVPLLMQELTLDGETICGRDFAKNFGNLPQIPYLLSKETITGTDWPKKKENPRKIPRPGDVLLEAEDFSSEEGGAVQIRSQLPSTSGNCIAYWDDWGHRISWHFRVPEAGNYTISLRYATATHSDRQLIVNGVSVGTFSFFEYRGFGRKPEEWIFTTLRSGAEPLVLNLPAGWNQITLVNAHGDPMNLDYILLRPQK